MFLQELNATMVMRDGVFSLSISPSAFILEDTPTILSITVTIDNAVHQDESVYVIEEDLPSSISVSYSVSAWETTTSESRIFVWKGTLNRNGYSEPQL